MINSNSEVLKMPLLISKDSFIIDGHHRWAALNSMNPDSIVKTVIVDLPIEDAIEEINEFHGVTHKGLENANT